MKKTFLSIAMVATVAFSPITTAPSATAADPSTALVQTTRSSTDIKVTDFVYAAKQAPAEVPLAKGESEDLSSKIDSYLAAMVFIGVLLWALTWGSPYNPNGAFAAAYK